MIKFILALVFVVAPASVWPAVKPSERNVIESQRSDFEYWEKAVWNYCIGKINRDRYEFLLKAPKEQISLIEHCIAEYSAAHPKPGR